MKHWIDFIDNRTHATKRLGKLANALTFEIKSKELELQNARSNLDRFETQICNSIASNYKSECEFENAISSAKHKADLWNNSPIDNHKPHSKK